MTPLSILTFLAESALRALIMAAGVGLALAVFRVRNVVAQKSAWIVVLAGGFLIPMVTPFVPSNSAWIPTIQPAALYAKAFQRLRGNLQPSPATFAQISGVAHRQTPALELHNSSTAAQLQNPAPRLTSPSELSANRARPVYSDHDLLPASSIAENAPLTHPEKAFPLPVFLPMVYAAVALLLLARFSVGLYTATRVWRSAIPVLGLPHDFARFPVRASARLSSPVTLGKGILLPACWTHWSTQKLRMVLAHEAAHVRQLDFFLQLFAGFYSAVFWFSPLGWWLSRKLCALAETISDGAALEHASSNAGYAQVLLEFASLHRSNTIGVAMARPENLPTRIERLLNESSFRQAFASAPIRRIVAGALVPAALFAAAALVQVGVRAGQAPAPAPIAPTPAPAPTTPVVAAPAPAAPVLVAGPLQNPAAHNAEPPAIAPAPPALPALAPSASEPLPPAALAAPPMPGAAPPTPAEPPSPARHHAPGSYYSYSSSYGDNDFHVFSSKNSDVSVCCGGMEKHRGEYEKARAMAKGDFLFFSHDGKSYMIDDPATLARLKSMYDKQAALARRQEELGRKQKIMGEKMEELSRHLEIHNLPAPDIAKEKAELDQALSKLEALKGHMLTPEQLGDAQSKLGDLQAKLGEMQGRMTMLDSNFTSKIGKLGGEMGGIGGIQGELGLQQGAMGRDIEHAIRTIVEEGLKNGIAKPIQ